MSSKIYQSPLHKSIRYAIYSQSVGFCLISKIRHKSRLLFLFKSIMPSLKWFFSSHFTFKPFFRVSGQQYAPRLMALLWIRFLFYFPSLSSSSSTSNAKNLILFSCGWNLCWNSVLNLKYLRIFRGDSVDNSVWIKCSVLRSYLMFYFIFSMVFFEAFSAFIEFFSKVFHEKEIFSHIVNCDLFCKILRKLSHLIFSKFLNLSEFKLELIKSIRF